ncbi:dual specificity protein phosphatase family protein [Rhizobiaceae bacterium CRRU44]|uniref:Dual specificity protein phosphatase family protein n=1 Tax=Ferranicluibacter rubi TaxID=2715133 RepID=A0AA43ZIR2_9HYPH|nr:dual specificity protein phosphatase family protein [Ferranicluibacter rubi]NHT77805.1 dual specificity protein phosphatase family protein [Ferranicluibacter rubi]
MINIRRHIRSHLLKTFGFSAVTAGICLGGYLGYLQLSGNFHTVIEGELYRSAQPSSASLERYVRRYGIKTVINLRGPERRENWYTDEIATASRLGVNHVDFSMSATREVTQETADKLVEIMKTAPKPILIHCKSGADRSGIAAALYSHKIAGHDEEISEGQLSIAFGHIGIPYLSRAIAMDRSWEDLEKQDSAKG